MRFAWAKTSGLAGLVLLLPTIFAPLVEEPGDGIQTSEALVEGIGKRPHAAADALHFRGTQGNPWTSSWTLQAGEVVVNWTRLVRQGVGTSPTDPSQSRLTVGLRETSGDESYNGASVTGRVSSSYANTLVIPRPGNPLGLETNLESPLTVQPSAGEVWRAGHFSNETTEVGQATHEASYTFRMAEDQAVIQGTEPFAGTVRGNFTLYVWGPEVTVRADDQNQNYWSGARLRNATGPGPRGTARDEHLQFLRIRATDAILQFDHTAGLAQWTTPDAVAQPDAAVTPSALAQTPDSDFQRLVGWILLASGVAALVGCVVWVIRRVRRERDWSIQLAKAQDDIIAKRYTRSDRRLARLLRRNPPTTDARLEACFLRGLGRLEMGNPAWLLRETASRMDELGNPAILAYLIMLAAVETGNMEAARKWGEIVRQDPSIWESSLGDERLQKHRVRLGLWGEGFFEATGYT